MQFTCRLYRKQVERGRFFIHENPAHAKSWALPCVLNMSRDLGVHIVQAGQFMFGLKTWGDKRSQLVLAKKPTKFLTNSNQLGREFNHICSGCHPHQQLLDGRAKDAARYPPALCRAICRGIMREKMQRACAVTSVLSLGSFQSHIRSST